MIFFNKQKFFISKQEYENLKTTLIDYLDKAEEFIAKNKKLSSCIMLARDEFINATASLRDSQKNYEHRIKSFLLWFLFNYKIPLDKRITPIELFNDSLEESTPNDYGKSLLNHQYSLFVLHKKTNQGVYIKNLFNNKKFIVANLSYFEGINPGEWFETRVFNISGHNILADYFIFHPPEMLKAVKKQISKNHGNEVFLQNLIFKLQNFYVKWLAYKKIAIKDIYEL